MIYPLLFWFLSALIDVLFDPRFKEAVIKEEIENYCKIYFVSMTSINGLYFLITRDLLGFLIAQAGYMLGIEDVLYFMIKGIEIPDKLDYLPFYMNTKSKLIINTVITIFIYAIFIIHGF